MSIQEVSAEQWRNSSITITTHSGQILCCTTGLDTRVMGAGITDRKNRMVAAARSEFGSGFDGKRPEDLSAIWQSQGRRVGLLARLETDERDHLA